MTNNINFLARDIVKELTPYASARSSMNGGSVWLNANENAIAPSYLLEGSFNRYPSCQPKQVIESYATYAGVESSQVLVSRGADEGIELLIRSFCEPKQDSITICPPTYGMYAISAESNRVDINIVPLNDNFTLNLAALFETKPKLVFICSPNNPTGNLIPREEIVATLEHFKNSALVVIDEAYIEFSPKASVVNLLNDYPNLVILRTLSKAFALAGLRCGFTLASKEIINALKKMIAPYPLAEPVAQIAQKALTLDAILTTQSTVNIINSLRDDFIHYALQQSAIKKVWPSDANFVLIQVANAKECVDKLIEQDILVRNQSSQLGLNEVVRISIGSKDDMTRLYQALDTYFNSINNGERA